MLGPTKGAWFGGRRRAAGDRRCGCVRNACEPLTSVLQKLVSFVDHANPERPHGRQPAAAHLLKEDRTAQSPFPGEAGEM